MRFAWSGISLKWKALKRRPLPEDWRQYGSRAALRDESGRSNSRATHPVNAATGRQTNVRYVYKGLDLDEEISAFEVPALFISGEDDTIVPIQTVMRDYDNYGGEKKLVVLEDSHHLPFMDQPDVVAREIRDFLVNLEQ